MHGAQKTEFVKVILALAATFRIEPTEALYEGYWLGMADLNLASIKGAAVKAMRTSRFMPTVSELREMAGVRVPRPEERATKAWATIVDCIGRLDYYNSVEFDDPVVHATIRAMGGWMRFWERWEDEGREWIAKEFCTTYRHLMATGFSREAGGYLTGYFEAANGRPHRLERVTTGLPAPDLPQLLTSIGRRVDHCPAVAVAQIGVIPE